MARGYVQIEPSQCKGCRVCIEACPRKCIVLSDDINVIGYQYARFEGEGCTACGLCYYVCPEPGAVTVYQDPGNEQTADEGE